MSFVVIADLLRLPKRKRLEIAERLWLSAADEAAMPVPAARRVNVLVANAASRSLEDSGSLAGMLSPRRSRSNISAAGFMAFGIGPPSDLLWGKCRFSKGHGYAPLTDGLDEASGVFDATQSDIAVWRRKRFIEEHQAS